MEKTQTAAGRFHMVAAALLWGLAGVCVKSISWGSMSVVAARSVLAFIVLIIAKGSFKIRFTKSNVLGALMTTATGALYVESIKLTTAGTAIVLQYVAPILVFLYAVLFQHRKAKPAEVILTAAVFGGIILSFADQLDPSHLLGNLLGLASGVTYAAQIIIQSRRDTDPGDSLLISCITSFAISFPFLFFDRGLSFDVKNVVWILVLGIFQYGMANVAFSRGIGKLEKVEASLILTIEPVFNPIPVAILCHEMMGPRAVAGALIVVVCVALYAMLPALENGSRHKPKRV